MLSVQHSVASIDTLSVEDEKIKETRRKDDSEIEQVSNSVGIMEVQNDRQIYASDAHWYAILSDIVGDGHEEADCARQFFKRSAATAIRKGRGEYFRHCAGVVPH